MQFGGAFWETFRGFNLSSYSFDSLFSKESITLAEVLNDDNLIQELKSQNSKLLEL